MNPNQVLTNEVFEIADIASAILAVFIAIVLIRLVLKIADKVTAMIGFRMQYKVRDKVSFDGNNYTIMRIGFLSTTFLNGDGLLTIDNTLLRTLKIMHHLPRDNEKNGVNTV